MSGDMMTAQIDLIAKHGPGNQIVTSQTNDQRMTKLPLGARYDVRDCVHLKGFKDKVMK